MERKMPEHKMSFGNKVRKLFGRTPKDESHTVENPDGRITTTKIKYNDDFSVHNMTITSMDTNGDTSIKTEYRDDSTATETHFDYSGNITREIKQDKYGNATELTRQSDGKYEEKYYERGKLFTGERILSSHSYLLKPGRKSSRVTEKTSVGIYIDGHKLGPTIFNPRYIKDAEQKKNNAIEELRQIALLKEAQEAIRSGNIKALDQIKAKALKQEELLQTPEFQSLLEQCYKQSQEGKDFAKLLEEGNYMEMQPVSKIESALARGRENIASTKETQVAEAPVTETKETQQTNVSKTQIAEMIAKSKINE